MAPLENVEAWRVRMLTISGEFDHFRGVSEIHPPRTDYDCLGWLEFPF